MDKAGALARKLDNDSSANRVDIAGVELPLAKLRESCFGSWVSEKNSSRKLTELVGSLVSGKTPSRILGK